MNRLRRLLVPTTLACALLAALTLTSAASAEVRTGEASSPVNAAVPGEADLLHASATYDSRTGSVDFDVTTREAPGSEPKFTTFAGLATVNGPCDASLFGTQEPSYPTLTVVSSFAALEPGSPLHWITAWTALEAEGGPGPETSGLGSWSLEETTATLAATAGPATGKPYNCAVVNIGTGGAPEPAGETLLFPISVPKPVEPPKPIEVTKTVTVTAPAPPAPAAAAPAKLTIAKAKALSATSGKWTKASVVVKNTGGTAVGPITVKAKAPAGVEVQPSQMKVPALLPGQSWSVGFRVKASDNAKASSTVALTASAGGLTAKGSLVLRLEG
jgi:hypothetical protein